MSDAETTPTRCPSWCVTPAVEHAGDDPDARVHEGPRFGLLRTYWVERTGDGGVPAEEADGDAGYSASIAEDAITGGWAGDLDAADLRRLATDALDAATWIERQAAAGPRANGRSVVDLVREAHARAQRAHPA